MPDSDEFWDFYWEVRLQQLQDLGKRAAILAVSQLIRRRAVTPGLPARLLELGCGEGQILGPLVQAHAGAPSIEDSVGVDYKASSLEKARRDYPGLRFVEGDFTDPALLARLGEFGIVLLVNALHEVFSAGYSPELGEVDVPAAKEKVYAALAGAAGCLAAGGSLVLFDGLESSGDLNEILQVRFLSSQARQDFETFAREYRPFRIAYRETGEHGCLKLSRRDFTRYITKSIFLGKHLWESERLESYQYFSESEYRAAFGRLGLEIKELRKLTVDEEKWRSLVEIETTGADFPDEHILIVAEKASPA